jgi:PAS domain S-box-containing protein
MASDSDQALHEQREWLRVTLASIGDAVITTDTSGNVTFLNPVAESLTGWSLADASGKSLTDVFNIVNEDTRKQVESPTVRALREGVVVGLANHTLLISRDGTERPIDDSAAPIRNAKEEVAGVVLVFRDITERRRHEKLVQDSLDYCTNILETLREPFLVLDKSLRVVSANRSFYTTFNVSPKETEKTFVFDLGNGQWNIPKLRELLEDILPSNGHTIDNFEVAHEFDTIGKKVMLLNARRIRQPGDHSELILLSIDDITERKRAEEGMAHLAAIVASSDDAIISKDLNGIITSWNQGAQRLFGYPAAEVIGKPISLLIPATHKDEEPRILERIRRGEAIDHYETVRQRKDGSLLDISLTVSPVRDAGGRIIGAAKIVRDITDRIRMEANLEASEIRYRRLFEAAQDGILILDLPVANAFKSLSRMDLLSSSPFRSTVDESGALRKG